MLQAAGISRIRKAIVLPAMTLFPRVLAGKFSLKGCINLNIPEGYCQCGCGQKTKIATRTRTNRGWIKDKPLKFVAGHAERRGNKNPNFKGGIVRGYNKIDDTVRWFITCRDGSRIAFARAVMEAKLKRTLKTHEHVHHINCDTTDDKPENLQLTTNKKHRKLHLADDGVLIESFRRLAFNLNRIPRQKDCDEDPHTPWSKTFSIRFKCWRNIIMKSGLMNFDPAYVKRYCRPKEGENI